MDQTPMHIAYEEVKATTKGQCSLLLANSRISHFQAKKDAVELNIPVTGSEVVGLVPLQAMLDAADYYIEKENLFVLHEDQKVHLAINRLGLATLSPFNPK